MNIREEAKRVSKDKEEQVFLSNVCDKLIQSIDENKLRHTNFLDTHQQSVVKTLLENVHHSNYIFDGGTEDAERKICTFLPDYETEMTYIKYIRAIKSKRDVLSHRDYLGSLMGLKIERDVIGDIYVHDDGADIIVLSDIAEYILLECSKAGRKTLELQLINKEDVKEGNDNRQEMRITVSSERLDAIVANAFNLSRSKSSEYIQSGRVLLNTFECTKINKVIKENDKITIRGKGKVVISEMKGLSKKGKQIIEIVKY